MLFQMIKKSPFFLCAGAMLVFASCSGEEATDVNVEETTIEEGEDVQVNAPKLINPESMGLNESQEEVENELEDVLEDVQPLNQPANDPTSKVMLNPPHGEPGHDCAIPVGQPLNSNAGVSNQPMRTTSPTINNQPVINTPNSGQVRLNPPHGEPGHDCAIPVGQPLN